MATKNESFILKEFIVGLVVILIFLFFLLIGLRKLTNTTFVKNLSLGSGKKPNLIFQEDLCASFPIFNQVKKDSKAEFERTVKRSGWLDKKYSYTRTYNTVERKQLAFQITSQSPEIPQETIILRCSKNEVEKDEVDSLLLSAFLNNYPESVAGQAVYEQNGKIILLKETALKDGQEWVTSLSLKGGLVMPNTSPSQEERYCFDLAAKGTAKYLGSEKLQTASATLDSLKIETVWEATPSVSLNKLRKVEDCYQYSEGFDTTATIKFKEEVWYVSDLGIVKRILTPLSIIGQPYFLPNGYLPLEITDEMVKK